MTLRRPSYILDGRGPDLSRLIVATETLIRLLPQTTSEPVDRREGGSNDPRQIMWQTYLGMRQRGELAGDENSFDFQRRRRLELEAEVAALKGEIEQLKVQLAGSVPLPPNAVKLRNDNPSPPAAVPAAPPKPVPTPPTDEERARALAIANAPVPQHIRDTRPPNEAWRNFVKIDWQG